MADHFNESGSTAPLGVHLSEYGPGVVEVCCLVSCHRFSPLRDGGLSVVATMG